jgi:hypothetical protein
MAQVSSPSDPVEVGGRELRLLRFVGRRVRLPELAVARTRGGRTGHGSASGGGRRTQVARLLTAASVEIRPVDPEHPDAQHCLEEYVAELNRRSTRRFDPSGGARIAHMRRAQSSLRPSSCTAQPAGLRSLRSTTSRSRTTGSRSRWANGDGRVAEPNRLRSTTRGQMTY